MKRLKLSKHEKQIENALLKSEYVDLSKTEFESIAHAIAARRKDAVLNLRMNSQDLASLKLKAHKLGIKYQTFISEVLHHVARG